MTIGAGEKTSKKSEPMGRQKKLFKKDDILSAIAGSYGVVNTVARRLKCDWRTAEKNIQRFPETIDRLAAEKEVLLDLVETKAITAVKNGDGAMIRYYLSTIGRKRGFTDKDAPDEKEESDNTLVFELVDTPPEESVNESKK